MIEKLRNFLNTIAGKVCSTGMIVIGLALAAWSVYANLGPSEIAQLASKRVYICSETGKTFSHAIADGENIPTDSPYSGNKTGYPAEACYWTKDGKIKSDPTYVMVGFYLGKSEPTFCRDCGRLVKPRNPLPTEGAPPPTQADYGNQPKLEE